MSTGHDKFHGRRSSADLLGRQLARRARNRCEFCRESTSLYVVEVEPVYSEPDPDRAVMICERCKRAVENARRRVDPEELRCLMESVWHETLPIQLASVRLSHRLSQEGVMWATELLDGLYLDPDIEALI
jgi:protein PhnA